MRGRLGRAGALAGQWRLAGLWQLAVATLLLVAGLFFAWQAWLIADEGSALARVHQARDELVQSLGSEIATQRRAIMQALNAPALQALADDKPALQAALHKALPQASQIEVFDANLDEVLHANYHQFGYAKAAQLLAALSAGQLPPMQTVNAGSARRLSQVAPLGPIEQPLAWVWIELPFGPIEQRFAALHLSAGRLQLRQGERMGDLTLLSAGGSVAEDEPTATPIAGSRLLVMAAQPVAFVVVPHSLPLAGALALLCLAGGGLLLWRRAHPPVKAAAAPDELLVADVVSAPREPARPLPLPLPPPAPLAAPPAPAGLAIDPVIFRAYDIRGVVGTTLDAEVARRIGQAVGTLMGEQGLAEIVVGRDGRLSSTELGEALIGGLREAGIDVIDLGAVPTPLVYFAGYRFNTGCGIAVTGSHNPPQYNGFKIVVGGQTLSEAAIADLHRRIVAGELRQGGEGGLRQVDVAADYLERVTGDVFMDRPFKVVVDAGNGIAGEIGPRVLEAIGAHVIPLYCEVDGEFPNHPPDPSEPANLKDLAEAVRQTGADLGLAFDGDGDRLAVVSHGGEVIYADRLLMLFARDLLARQPGATVLYDVKCSGLLKGEVLAAGGSPLMGRSGHSLMKARMRETGAELAGEMSGHFFFQERWYGFDDGIYAAARLLEILAGDLDQRSPDQVFDSLPKAVSTPELKVAMAEGEPAQLVEALRGQADFEGATLSQIDGIRADWPDGWGLVRASNTTPSLVLRFEADQPAALRRIQQLFRDRLLALRPGLKLPF